MRKKAEKEPKVYRKQFVLFPELWGGMITYWLKLRNVENVNQNCKSNDYGRKNPPRDLQVLCFLCAVRR